MIPFGYIPRSLLRTIFLPDTPQLAAGSFILFGDFHYLNLHKNLLNCSGILSTSRSSPVPSVTAAGPEPELHHHLAPDRDEIEPRFQFPSAGVVQSQNPAPV